MLGSAIFSCRFFYHQTLVINDDIPFGPDKKVMKLGKICISNLRLPNLMYVVNRLRLRKVFTIAVFSR